MSPKEISIDTPSARTAKHKEGHSDLHKLRSRHRLRHHEGKACRGQDTDASSHDTVSPKEIPIDTSSVGTAKHKEGHSDFHRLRSRHRLGHCERKTCHGRVLASWVINFFQGPKWKFLSRFDCGIIFFDGKIIFSRVLWIFFQGKTFFFEGPAFRGPAQFLHQDHSGQDQFHLDY